MTTVRLELGPFHHVEHTISAVMSNVLYCGDNLEVLAEYVASESVDLVYLDPPFNSQRTFNVVYKDSRAQEEAFKDYWSWAEAASTYVTYVGDGGDAPLRLRAVLRALHDVLINDDPDLLAYLVMMAPRLVAMHRALKPTGSLYLHCDPTASHYLKVILDVIFGADRFQNEIIWRSTPKNDPKRYGRRHDVILFYSRGDTFTWNQQFTPFEDYSVAKNYTAADPDGRRFRLSDLTANKAGGDVDYEWHGKRPYKGRHWAFSREKMDQMFAAGRIVFRRTGMPVYKRYLDEMPGVAVQDVWTDIGLASAAPERTGYPTQKPVSLLERIITASSNPGEVVLDPFCGCGTTIVACEKLGREWIGIDIARTAVDVLEERFKANGLPEPSIIWHPADAEAAAALAERDPDQFELWVRRKLRAEKRRRDRGIDGEFFSKDDTRGWHVIISVKGGKMISPAMVRELRGTIERERAAIGVLVCTVEPSKEMRLEATRAEFLPVSDMFGPIPRIQIVTVAQLLNEKRPVRAPGENMTPKAPPTPHKGQTAMLFPTAKARPAQEARARARTARTPTPARAASGATAPPPSKPPSKSPPSSRR